MLGLKLNHVSKRGPWNIEWDDTPGLLKEIVQRIQLQPRQPQTK